MLRPENSVTALSVLPGMIATVQIAATAEILCYTARMLRKVSLIIIIH